MKKGIHPALQWLSLVTPQGRLVRVLSAQVFKSDRPFYIRDPGKKAETEGQIAKFNKRRQVDGSRHVSMRRNDVSAWRPANEFTSCCEEGDGAGREGTHDSGADSYRGDAWCNGVGMGGKEGDEGRMSGRAREGEHSYGETAFEARQEQQEYASVGASSEGSAAGPQGCAWQRQQQGYSALSTHSQPDFLRSYGETETSFDAVESADGGGAPMAARHVAELSPSLHRHPEGWDAALMRTLEADPLGVHGGGMISAGVDGGGMNGAWVNCAVLNGAGMHGGGVDGGGMNGGCMQGASPPHTSPAELLSCASTSCLLHLRSLSPTPTPTHPSHPGLSLSPPPVVPPLSLTTSTAPAPAPLTPPLPCCPAATCPTHTPSHSAPSYSARSHFAPPVAPPHHASHNACTSKAWLPSSCPQAVSCRLPYSLSRLLFSNLFFLLSSLFFLLSSPSPLLTPPARPLSCCFLCTGLAAAFLSLQYESEFYSSMVHHRGIISWGAVDPCQQQATPFIPNLPRTPFPFSPPSPPPPYSIRYESEFYSNVVHHRGIISWGAVDHCQPDRLVGFITARLVPPAEAQVCAGRMAYQVYGSGFITARLVPPAEAQAQCGTGGMEKKGEREEGGVGMVHGVHVWAIISWGAVGPYKPDRGGVHHCMPGSAWKGTGAVWKEGGGSAAWGYAAWGCAAYSGADVLPLTPPSPHHTPPPSLVYILTLGVSKRYRKAGVASHLVHLLLSHAASLPHCAAVYLHVVAYNAAAIRFYRSLRFCFRRRLSRFYYLEGGEYDALLFARYVNGWSPPDSRSQLQGPTLQLLQPTFTAASAAVSAAMSLVCVRPPASLLRAAMHSAWICKCLEFFRSTFFSRDASRLA
ncbi:unnamed protein product [Closterium sp. NIES-65]|nr:unnamed protein product [Closterium sp. NIES-65]